MKNHFIFPYAGNKREEVVKIYENINFDNIKTIIEPYCGSSAISFYISSQQPKKYKYILNDNNSNLINLYKLMKNKKETNKFNKEINKRIIEFNKCKTNEERKIYYKSLMDVDNVYNYFFTAKYKTIRRGLCPLFDRIKQINIFDVKEYPIYNFINTEDIKIINKEAIDIIKEYNTNEQNYIIMDPPYISTCNDFYDNANMNIYEWLYNNNIDNMTSKIMIILENIWINKLLFARNKILKSYSKVYQTSKKKTEHIIILNNK